MPLDGHLDDGVMVNSAALWPLLEPQWNDPKKWWKDLTTATGRKDYDWSRQVDPQHQDVDHPCMKILDVPFNTTDWSSVPPTTHPGEQGAAYWRTLEVGNIRVRMVEYSAGYIADHWCERGHVLLVLKGELVTELKNGESHVLQAGQSYQVADGAMAHRSRTEGGATLFIVD